MDEKKLIKALKITCGELVKMCKQTKCKDCHFVKEQKNGINDCPCNGNTTIYDWQRWALEKVERR